MGFSWIFHYKPSFWGTPQDYGNPHLSRNSWEKNPLEMKPCFPWGCSSSFQTSIKGLVPRNFPQHGTMHNCFRKLNLISHRLHQMRHKISRPLPELWKMGYAVEIRMYLSCFQTPFWFSGGAVVLVRCCREVNWFNKCENWKSIFRRRFHVYRQDKIGLINTHMGI